MQIKNLREYDLDLKEAQEFCVLCEQLDPADMYVIGFLKNINRNAMRRMSRAGLFDVNYN